MVASSYGLATLEKPTLSVDGDFACHICRADGVITSVAQAILIEDKTIIVAVLNQIEYTLTCRVSVDGQLSGMFRPSKGSGLQGEVAAISHSGGFIGTYTYLDENASLVERKLRLVRLC